MMQRLDRPLGQQWTQREGHVRAAHELLDGDGHRPREATTAELGIERHGSETGGNVLLVCSGEARRSGDTAVLAAVRTDLVPVAVRRGDDLGHETTDLGNHHRDGLGVDALETVGTQQIIHVDDVVEHELDVGDRG